MSTNLLSAFWHENTTGSTLRLARMSTQGRIAPSWVIHTPCQIGLISPERISTLLTATLAKVYIDNGVEVDFLCPGAHTPASKRERAHNATH
jgi:hypothetical protein